MSDFSVLLILYPRLLLIDDNVFNRFITPEITVHSDVKFFSQALIPQVNASEYLLWDKEFSELKEVEIENVLTKSLSRTEGPITMVEFMHVLSEKTQKDSVLITDIGEHQMIASKIYQPKHAHSLVTSGGYGTMSFGLPAAIGVKIAAPNHQAILIAGDGGFQMTLQELQVLSQEALDIKIVILNNIRLGMIQFWQDVFYAQHESYSKITSPNFDLIANAYGIPSRVLTKRSDLVSAIDELLSLPISFLLDVHTDPEEGCFPIIPKGIDKVSMIFK